MITSLIGLFDTTGFVPRWFCGDWSQAHGWVHIISDLLIFGAYTAIPIVLVYFAVKRKDVPFQRIFLLFGVFIFACGTTHLIEAIIFWEPIYRFSAAVKVVTALASWGTVLALIPITPKALALPGLARVNEDLQRQIAQREEAEQKLRDRESRLRAVVETAVDAIITIDEHGIVDSVNAATEKLFGYRRGELIGQNVKIIMPPPYRKEHDEYLKNYLTTGERKIIGIGREVVGQRKDGSTFPIDLAVSEMAVGGRRMFTGIARDITERERVAEELMDVADELQRKSREKQEFFAILAHDLKHPVISIQGLLSLLKNDVYEKLDDESRENLRLSLSECERMRDMLGRINELGKIDYMMPRHEAIALDAFVENCVDRFRPRAEPMGVTLTVTAPSVQVKISRWHLEQALSNLLDNAFNYGCQGGACKIDVIASVEAGKGLITVRDYGQGIDPRHHQRIFEPFRRLTPGTGPAGSGIGLTAVRQLMNRIDGDVLLESKPGDGASFTLVFPV